MVHSLNKGKAFEREVANLLTEKTGAKWQRVPMSGAFATVNKSNDARFDGDVFTEDYRFNNIVVECKSNKKDVNLNSLFSKKSLFWSWVSQCKCESRNKPWVLFIKLTRIGMFAVSDRTSMLSTLCIDIEGCLKVDREPFSLGKPLWLVKLK